MSHNRSPPPGGASEGGSHKSHQGTQQDAQVTAKFDEATARQTHATPTDIYDELATTSKHKPLHKSGFVSPPTTATTDARRASGTVALVMLSPSAPAAMQEQRTQVATGGSAGNTSNHRRFFGHRSRPPHQRGPGHGTHQRRATQCSEHDAHNKMVNEDRPTTIAPSWFLTTSVLTMEANLNNAHTVQVGKQHAMSDRESSLSSSP